jgi:predicted O-linked N-acetylglucosamine transferase (SPINDLY family)
MTAIASVERLRAAAEDFRAGRLEQAETHVRAVLESEPRHPGALLQLGLIALTRGAAAEAEPLLREAASGVNLGAAAMAHADALERLERHDECEAALRLAIARDAALAPAWSRLGAVLLRRGACSEAEAAFRAAIAVNPRWATPRIALAQVLLRLGRSEEAAQALAEAARLDAPRAARIESQALFAMHHSERIAPEALHAAHVQWAGRHAPSGPRVAMPRRERGRIAIGYVSPRFQRSSLAFALLPVLASHDRDRFEIHCYSEQESEDEWTERFRALADHWRVTIDRPDDEVEAMIRHDDIDVLVDLAGHTPGNRLPVFARRPARAAVSWLDYFDTTGIEAIDALVVDDEALQPGLAQRFVEKPLSAGCVRYPYSPPAYAPAVRDLPSAQGGHVTFGSFARLAKITPTVLAAWCEILARAPHARLRIKNDALQDTDARRHLLGRFDAQGIDPARIELRAESAHDLMLAEYGEIDVVLDTFPYNGGITTLEALWMGRPVLTLRGDTVIARQGASILRAIGLEEMIAENVDAYVERATRCAAAPERLASASSLRERVRASALCDAKAFTRRLESLYVQLLDGEKAA